MSVHREARDVRPGTNINWVVTNDFHQVLRHFNEDGIVLDGNTYIDITCHICQEACIGPIHPRFPGQTKPYEHYAVLKHCGHAFGYKCLFHSLLARRINEPSCPTCGTKIFPERGQPRPLVIYGIVDLESQREQIRSIRQMIEPPPRTGAERMSISALMNPQPLSPQGREQTQQDAAEASERSVDSQMAQSSSSTPHALQPFRMSLSQRSQNSPSPPFALQSLWFPRINE
ncbi:hypothetical protein GGR58DRAFT_500934 [Xylaria digitata]|nr:hypothetical protein GGR58DRAFT_500934 [Xylaria digitata]